MSPSPSSSFSSSSFFYRKETKGWVLRFLRRDGEGLLALVLILPFALVSLSRLLGAFHLPAEGYLRVLFLGFLLEPSSSSLPFGEDRGRHPSSPSRSPSPSSRNI